MTWRWEVLPTLKETSLSPAAQWTNTSQQCKVTVPQDLAVTQQVIRLDQIKIGQIAIIHCLLAHHYLLWVSWAGIDFCIRLQWGTDSTTSQMQAHWYRNITSFMEWFTINMRFYKKKIKKHKTLMLNGEAAVKLLEEMLLFMMPINRWLTQQRFFKFQRGLRVFQWMSSPMISYKDMGQTGVRWERKAERKGGREGGRREVDWDK